MIIVRIWEGLGNQLFQYAFAKAISLKTNQAVYLDVRETGKRNEDFGISRKYKLNNFNISMHKCLNAEYFYPHLKNNKMISYFAKCLVNLNCLPYKYYEEKVVSYKEELLHLDGNWYLQGYFQNAKYFQEYEDILRKEIVPRKKIKISKELRVILNKKNTVSVHIRRGDYEKIKSTLPISYYQKAMETMKTFIENPIWVIFSDDPDWVRKNIVFDNNSYYVSGNEDLLDYEELLVMSKCKNQIISNSSFSWWGAWLNKNQEKVVIGPKKWFIGEMSNHKGNIMLDEWIKI